MSGSYTLESPLLRARIATYGATLLELWAPDREGRAGNVVLGRPALADYADGHGTYLGAVCGRYANRIANARFTLDGVEHRIPANDGESALHGGTDGFDRREWEAREWEAEPGGDALVLRLTSPDGDMGFPGELCVEVTYALAGDALRIDYRATTDRTTVVNLTNHTYWNLAGEGSGPVYDHVLEVAAPRYVEIGPGSIPTGELAAVAGTPLDFTGPARICDRIREPFDQLALACGYDHCFVLGGGAPAARVHDPATGRALEVSTTEPGLQVYTGNHLDGSVEGTGGTLYRQGDGLALETQHFPDSPNQPAFPSTVLRPGEELRSTTVYRLTTG